MKNYIQDGHAMTWTNGSGSDVPSGEPVVVGEVVGVATGIIKDTETGELIMDGVVEVAKEAPLVITQGDMVYFDDTLKEVDKTNTNPFIGYCFLDAESADTVVRVLLARQGD